MLQQTGDGVVESRERTHTVYEDFKGTGRPMTSDGRHHGVSDAKRVDDVDRVRPLA